MKTLYFHIGWRKTGTSAIQSFITNNVSDNMIGDVYVIPVGQREQDMVVGGMPLVHHPLVRFWPAQRWHSDWETAADFVSQSKADRFLMTTEVMTSRIQKHAAFLEQLAGKLLIFIDDLELDASRLDRTVPPGPNARPSVIRECRTLSSNTTS